MTLTKTYRYRNQNQVFEIARISESEDHYQERVVPPHGELCFQASDRAVVEIYRPGAQDMEFRMRYRSYELELLDSEVPA
jgi:Domain of unknown function (DUF1830)